MKFVKIWQAVRQMQEENCLMIKEINMSLISQQLSVHSVVRLQVDSFSWQKTRNDKMAFIGCQTFQKINVFVLEMLKVLGPR